MSATAITATKSTATKSGNKTMYNIGYVDRFVAITPDLQELYNDHIIDYAELAKAWGDSMQYEGDNSYFAYMCEIKRMIVDPVERSWHNDDEYSFTMDNILKDMCLRTTDGFTNMVTEPLAIELGKFINLFLPDRSFEKVMVNVSGKNMSVKLYYDYERDQIENLVKVFFNRLDLIKPSHLLIYAFTVKSLLQNIVSSLDGSDTDREANIRAFVNDVCQHNSDCAMFQDEILSYIPNFDEDEDCELCNIPSYYRPYLESVVLDHIPEHYIFFKESAAAAAADI